MKFIRLPDIRRFLLFSLFFAFVFCCLVRNAMYYFLFVPKISVYATAIFIASGVFLVQHPSGRNCFRVFITPAEAVRVFLLVSGGGGRSPVNCNTVLAGSINFGWVD